METTEQPTTTTFVARNWATGELLSDEHGETVVCRTFDGAVTMIICLIPPAHRLTWNAEVA
jgi:hypothetical protein